MERLAARFGITALRKLGRCGFCMRAAFLCAAIASLAAIVAAAALPDSDLVLFIAALAIAFALLWLSHIAAYAMRVAQFARRHPDAPGAIGHSRRGFIRLFARTSALAALATSLPMLLAVATRAQDGCPGHAPYPCGSSWCCSGPSLYFCQGYVGFTPNWRAMGTFCTSDNTDEAIADLSSNCAIFEYC